MPPGPPGNFRVLPWDDAIQMEWVAPSSWGTWDEYRFEVEISGESPDWYPVARLGELTPTTGRAIAFKTLGNTPDIYNGQTGLHVRIRASSIKPGTTPGAANARYLDSSWVSVNNVSVGRPHITELTLTPREQQIDIGWAKLVPRTDKPIPDGATQETRDNIAESSRKYVYTGYDIHYTSSRTVASGADVTTGTDHAAGWVDANYSGGGDAGVFSIENLDTGTRYRVRMRGINGYGAGAWIERSAVIPGPLKAYFEIHTILAPENDDSQAVSIILNQVPDREITVNLSTIADKCGTTITATEGADADYTLSAKSFTFASGTTTLAQTLTIYPIEDQNTEGRESGCVSMVNPPASANFEVDQKGVYLEFVDTSQGSDVPPLRFYDHPVEEHGEGSRIYGVLSLNTPRDDDVDVTITVLTAEGKKGTASTDDYTVVSEFLTGTIKAGQALYDRTTRDPKNRSLITLVDDDDLESPETIKLEARIDGEDYVARQTVIILDNDGIDPVKVTATRRDNTPAIEFESSLQSGCGRHSDSSRCGLAAQSYRYSRSGYTVLFQVKESGQDWVAPHDYNWQVPTTPSGTPASVWSNYYAFPGATINGGIKNLKPGVTYDVRAYVSHVPAAWTGGSFDRSEVEGKEIYGVGSKPIISDTVSVTLGSIPSPPRLNNLESRENEIRVSWEEPVILGADRLTGYKLRWKKSSASTWNDESVLVANRFFTITPTDAVEYEAQVKAVNPIGESDWTEIRRAIGIKTPPPPPVDSTQTATPPTDTQQPQPPSTPREVTARFEDVPGEHDGTQFRITLRFDEDIVEATAYGWFDVINGRVANYWRRSARLYWIYIQPNHPGQDVKILKHKGTCGGTGACTADGRLSNRIDYTTIPSMSVAPVIQKMAGKDYHGTAQEGSPVEFVVTLGEVVNEAGMKVARPAPMAVTFNYRTTVARPPYKSAYRTSSCRTPEGSNTNPDMIEQSGSITFHPGDTSKTISIATCPPDSIDEPDRYFSLALSGDTFAGHRVGLGRIYNDGPLQAAWLSRLGRTVGTQIADAVTGRFTDTPHVRVGGRPVGAFEPLRPQSRSPVRPQPPAHSPGRAQPQIGDGHRPSPRDLLAGSSFHHARDGYAAWGNFRQSRFAGSEVHDGGALHLDGTVLTGVFGADATVGRLLAGAALAYTDSLGSFDAAADSGVLTSTLTTLAPYARVQLTGRLSAFGLLGYGVGDTTIEQKTAGSDTHATVTLDHTTRLASAGIRGELPSVAGIGLAINADTLYTATDAPEAPGSAATHAATARARVALEAGRAFVRPRYSIHPTVELAARYDTGDAETGAGLEVASGLRVTHASGVSVDASARQLLTHADAHEDRGISLALAYAPDGALGWTAALTTSIGNTTSAAQQLWNARSARDFASHSVGPAASVEAALGYGFPAFRHRVIATPRLTARDSAGARETQFGWSFTPYRLVQSRKSHFEVSFDTTRTVSPAGPSHGAMLKAAARW